MLGLDSLTDNMILWRVYDVSGQILYCSDQSGVLISHYTDQSDYTVKKWEYDSFVGPGQDEQRSIFISQAMEGLNNEGKRKRGKPNGSRTWSGKYQDIVREAGVRAGAQFYNLDLLWK